ncbi:hypothetical protein [Methylococcus sp. EFPC2]|uniref:hypothetical protein n=1 Tax=Methylococcus sp. EFPC2 TaxID=2812648 RepID=UPI001966E271|nr:hypothetical protein [Methylococcus sp. EFPC2]QSA97036.1 hypothetical protein JWZ97_17830 [Methylococcus sp. EFPC2]
MNMFSMKPLAGLLMAACAAFSGNVLASTVNFTGVATATSGHANTDSSSGSFVQDGVVVGVVADPTDSGAHFHRAGLSSDREAQYHPDSTGIYVRREDKQNFSLQSIWLDVTNGETPAGVNPGSYVIYGYANAVNDPLLSNSATGEPEWGQVTPVATYSFANDGVFAGNVSLATLDPAWGNIGAFWIHFAGFPHSPTTNYLTSVYPDFDLRVDDIVLGDVVLPPPASVPVPAAVWLFGSALAGVGAISRRKKAA